MNKHMFKFLHLQASLPTMSGRNRLHGLFKAGSIAVNRLSTESKSETLYDVVISGGGMVGASMAASLACSGQFANKRILLLEAGAKKTIELPAKHSSRTCALSPATVNLLSSFGAWDKILSKRAQPVKRMEVWEDCSSSRISFSHDDMTHDLAYIVENDVILGSVFECLDKAGPSVEVRYGAKVDSYFLPNIHEQDWARLRLADGQEISTRLLIGADGFNSLVRKTADIHSISFDYDQYAVVSTLQLHESTNNVVAWQRFMTTGPIALLPVSDEYSCLIWTTTPENAKSLLQLSADSFVDAVNTALWSDTSKLPLAESLFGFLDRFFISVGLSGSSSNQLPPTVTNVDLESRAAFPLGFCHASHYVRNRMVLIGDAAHRIHPLAGQGVNLGFGDVIALTEKLQKAAELGKDVGALSHLLEYETQRQRQILPVMATVDGLNRLYSTNFAPVVLLRTLGLQATNAVKPIKDLIIKQASL